MPTFLQLVNDLERESGTISQGSRLGTVVGAPGRQEKMVDWVREGWRLIQTARTDWPWMKEEFTSAAVTAGDPRYTATELGINDLQAWVQRRESLTIYDTALGRADETSLRFFSYEEWKLRWDRGVHADDRPVDAAIDHKGQLCLGSTPNKSYTLRGEYHRRPQVLLNDGDVPWLPEEHHNLIVWRAMVLLGEHDEAPVVIQTANAKVMSGLRALVDASMEACSV